MSRYVFVIVCFIIIFGCSSNKKYDEQKITFEQYKELEKKCNRAAKNWFVYGNLEAVENSCNEAIEKSQYFSMPDVLLITPFVKLGSVNMLMRRCDKALELFNKARKLYDKLSLQDERYKKEIENAIVSINKDC